MIQPGKETNAVFPIRPTAGSMPNLSNVMQNKVVGIDGITITFGVVITVIVLYLAYQMLFAKKRR